MSTTVVSPRERLRVAQARIQERSTWAVASVLGLLSLLAFVLLYRKGFGTTFYYDEWNFLMNRRDWTIGTFLEPHNEHLSLVPIARLQAPVRRRSESTTTRPTASRSSSSTCSASRSSSCSCRRRVGDLLGAIVVLPILFLGTAWQDLLWPFQIGYLASVAAGLGMLLALERRTAAGRHRGVRADRGRARELEHRHPGRRAGRRRAARATRASAAALARRRSGRAVPAVVARLRQSSGGAGRPGRACGRSSARTSRTRRVTWPARPPAPSAR